MLTLINYIFKVTEQRYNLVNMGTSYCMNSVKALIAKSLHTPELEKLLQLGKHALKVNNN